MKYSLCFVIVAIALISCNTSAEYREIQSSSSIEGTWKLLSGTTIEKNDTAITDYTKNKSFIKVINKTHFAFIGHDLNNGKDSLGFFSVGSGKYELHDSAYTEHLEYCNDRRWEGNNFSFIITMHNDTLIQQGIEKIEEAGVNRINIERYIRIKD